MLQETNNLKTGFIEFENRLLVKQNRLPVNQLLFNITGYKSILNKID